MVHLPDCAVDRLEYLVEYCCKTPLLEGRRLRYGLGAFLKPKTLLVVVVVGLLLLCFSDVPELRKQSYYHL